MIIFDTESDGLADEATKFHIFSWTTDGNCFHSTSDSDEFIRVLDQHEFAGCHNCVRHDFALLKRLESYKYKGVKVDTLALSWYLFPERSKHGLESWGEDLGFPKVEVEKEEWANLSWDKAKERCERDVLINWKVWEVQRDYLRKLYG